LTALLLFVFSEQLFSGSRFVGIVTNKDNIPIQDVNIELFTTSLGAVTDENGYFYLSRINNGKYTLKFSHISYRSHQIEIFSGVEDKVKLKIQLESNYLELDPIIISKMSSFSEKKIIERKEIELSSSSNFEELLKDLSAISIDKTDGINTKISIRGSESKQVCVMVDGMIINSAMDGSFDLNTIPIDIIEQVEIYKGGDISLSSQGMGGIINVITKKNIKNKEFSLKYSNSGYLSNRDEMSVDRFGNNQVSATASWPFIIGNLTLSYSHKENDNNWSYINAAKADEYRYINNPNTPREQTNAYNNGDNLYTMFNGDFKEVKYGLTLNYNTVKYGMPGWYDQLFKSAYLKNKDLKFRIFSECKFDKHIGMKIEAYQDYGWKYVYIDEISSMYFVDNEDIFNNKGVKVSTSISSGSFNLFSGLEYKKEQVESEMITGFKQFRENSSAFSKLELIKNIFNKNNKIQLQGSIREEYFSNTKELETLFSYGAFTEILLGRVLIIPKFRYNRNYRLPTFSSMFWADNLYSSGNPDLKPEFSNMYESSLSLSLTSDMISTSISFSYYNKQLEDLIVWVKKSTGKYVPENLRGGEISGTESELDIS
ncbi:MAG: TonB-dependent receptor plug domain-containing protein, partial [Candidatus Delongbacteria bacterium]|nr:TonB-dependent receptor plug domain-containing protein [Candidatus Delongbacteria bacterium]